MQDDKQLFWKGLDILGNIQQWNPTKQQNALIYWIKFNLQCLLKEATIYKKSDIV